MRAALLPTPGDPFMLAYWLRNYETWAAAVDDLVVLVNGQTDPEVLAYDRAIVEAAGGRFFSTPDRIGHDGAILRLLQLTGARHVVLCEDDAYVRKPAEVARAFARIEDGELDIIGSPRHEDYASSPLQVWPDELTKEHEEVRRGFWPAFLFIARDDLLSTDRIFGDRRWNIGNTIAGLDMPVTRDLCEYVGISPNYIHLDTLFGTTFQLRARNPKVELVHHVRLFDAAGSGAVDRRGPAVVPRHRALDARHGARPARLHPRHGRARRPVDAPDGVVVRTSATTGRAPGDRARRALDAFVVRTGCARRLERGTRGSSRGSHGPSDRHRLRLLRRRCRA
jgi:hypothetical protein